jgi:hypothetical protein
MTITETMNNNKNNEHRTIQNKQHNNPTRITKIVLTDVEIVMLAIIIS